MEIFSIASGSSGNCICVGNDKNHVMIDAGISGKRIEAGMNEYDMTTSDCDGILITHEHSDHVGGLGVIARKYGLPIYTTRGTMEAIRASKYLGRIDDSLFHVIRPDEDFNIGELTIHPFSVSHDAADPVAYIVSDACKRIGVVTDLGTYDDYIIENISGLNAILIEANHDVRMLQAGRYPYPLKQRILGDRGHLSNENSGRLLSAVLNDDIEHVFLGHLSAENNYEQLALSSVKMEVSMSDTPYRGTDFPITVASREFVSERIAV
ncbi:MAG: MBL fold metallo-hydrolase [Lachnospiraceae bacterium]|nr:MBL fold metallo-hydrolase [Lachnospiraceae bacterium]